MNDRLLHGARRDVARPGLVPVTPAGPPRTRARRMTRLSMLMCVPVVVACYSYRVVPVESVTVGSIVRARVTSAEGARIAEEIGREARVLEGELLEHHDDGILLAVSSTLDDNGRTATRAHQRVAIPCAAILELEMRRLDRLKTSGVVALAVGMAAYVGIRAFGSEGDPTGDGKGGPNQSVGRP